MFPLSMISTHNIGFHENKKMSNLDKAYLGLWPSSKKHKIALTKQTL